MRKWITLLMTFIVGATTTSYVSADAGRQVNFEVGYRHDDITWSHAFPDHNPLVSSKTKFKDLDIFQLGVNARGSIGYNLYLRAGAYWGWILDGEFERRVSTYAFNDSYYFDDSGVGLGFWDKRTSLIDDRYVYGINAAIGYPFYFCDCSVTLAPVIGYALDQQNIEVHSNDFDFNDAYGVLYGDSGECCHHTFTNRWYGPFVGVDFNYQPWGECWNFYGNLEYHWGYFKGKRDNGDGFDFGDHGHRKSRHATGWVFALGANYDLCDRWTVGLSVKFQDWRGNRHHNGWSDDYSGDYYVFGSGCCGDRARQHHKWNSYSVNLTFGHEF